MTTDDHTPPEDQADAESMNQARLAQMAAHHDRRVARLGFNPGDTTTIRLPRDLVEQVRDLAHRHDRSLSAELRVALADYVKRES